jgi:methylaspartate mutase sigma subunit
LFKRRVIATTLDIREEFSMSAPLRECKVILGVIGADCHAVGNKILSAVLTDNGIEVVNLGVMVSQEEFIDAALNEDADAILVSSIYGHGEIDCQGFRARCEERGLADIVLYVGGNLVIGKRPFAEVEDRFIGMGFDRVFRPTADLKDMIELLVSDVENRRPAGFGHNSRAFRIADPQLERTA